jgi:hypothetical protein
MVVVGTTVRIGGHIVELNPSIVTTLLAPSNEDFDEMNQEEVQYHVVIDKILFSSFLKIKVNS